jgi:hypothetical protein
MGNNRQRDAGNREAVCDEAGGGCHRRDFRMSDYEPIYDEFTAADDPLAGRFEPEDDEPSGGCYRCGGAGEINVCIDDLCRGADECFHGDGMAICPVCEDGEI